MTEYRLTAEELLYLAAAAGAETFYGVPDMLSGLTDQELKLKVVEIEESLGKKGHLEEDFDGNKNVVQKLLNLIESCGNCEKFLSFEHERVGEMQHSCLYFWKDGASYKMDCEKEEYVLSEIGNAQIREEIKGAMTIREMGEKDSEEFLLSNEALEKAGTLIRGGSVEKGEELLREAGATEWMAHMISGGILTQADFFALLFMDMSGGEESSYSIQCLQGEKIVLMEYEMVEDEDFVQFSVTDDAELKRRMAAGFEKIGCVQEDAGGFV